MPDIVQTCHERLMEQANMGWHLRHHPCDWNIQSPEQLLTRCWQPIHRSYKTSISRYHWAYDSDPDHPNCQGIPLHKESLLDQPI